MSVQNIESMPSTQSAQTDAVQTESVGLNVDGQLNQVDQVNQINPVSENRFVSARTKFIDAITDFDKEQYKTLDTEKFTGVSNTDVLRVLYTRYAANSDSKLMEALAAVLKAESDTTFDFNRFYGRLPKSKSTRNRGNRAENNVTVGAGTDNTNTVVQKPKYKSNRNNDANGVNSNSERINDGRNPRGGRGGRGGNSGRGGNRGSNSNGRGGYNTGYTNAGTSSNTGNRGYANSVNTGLNTTAAYNSTNSNSNTKQTQVPSTGSDGYSGTLNTLRNMVHDVTGM